MQRPSVLLLERDSAWLRRCATVLSNAGFHVDVTEDLLDMRNKLAFKRCEVAVVPSYLEPHGYLAPVRLGKELCRGCKVLVLSAAPSERDMVDAYDLGAAKYLPKPVNPKPLVRVVCELTNTRVSGRAR